MIRRRLAARREDPQGSPSHSTERQGGPRHDYEQVEEGIGRAGGGCEGQGRRNNNRKPSLWELSVNCYYNITKYTGQ